MLTRRLPQRIDDHSVALVLELASVAANSRPEAHPHLWLFFIAISPKRRLNRGRLPASVPHLGGTWDSMTSCSGFRMGLSPREIMPLSLGQNGDVLSTVDHRDEETARRWAIESAVGKPWRPTFRAAFARILGEIGPAPPRILELGSGPGLLARRVLLDLAVSEYVLLDFSEPMMRMARETLGPREDVTYRLCDFKGQSWHQSLAGPFDAVISMQAVHEIRHKRHVPRLYSEVATLLRPGGLLLVCDHEPAPDANELALQLASTADEQEQAMQSAGFVSMTRQLFERRCYLISALKPAQNS